MSEAHHNILIRPKRLHQPSGDIHYYREGRAAIINSDQRLFDDQIDRWINEGGALSPRESLYTNLSQQHFQVANACF
jgi:hypothetical protein